MKIFLERVINNTLAMIDGLFYRSIISENTCARCKMQSETTDHALLNWSYTKSVWKQIYFSTNLPKFKHISLKDAFIVVYEKMNREDAITFGLTAWSICHSRNRFIYEGEVVDPKSTVSWVQSYYEQLKEIDSSPEENEERSDRRQKTITWKAPVPHQYILNVDAAVKQDLNLFSLGLLIRDSTGQVMVGTVLNRKGSPSVTKVETTTVLKRVNLARDLFFLRLWSKLTLSWLLGF